jgi:hypothetical protein
VFPLVIAPEVRFLFLNRKTIGCTVRAMRFLRALALLAVTLSCLGTAAGQITTMMTVDGKEIACTRSGLWSDLNDCGTRSDWYSYVFVGSIYAIAPTAGEEKQIQIVPEEIFLGKPGSLITVITDAGICLPKMQVGDRWLFYLRQEGATPIKLPYGGDSLPVAYAQEQIATLRRLETIGNLSILRGHVMRGESDDGKPLPNARVTARSKSDGTQFSSTTDADGRYEFQLLPAGSYKITVAPVGSYQPDKSGIDLKPGACWDLTLSRSPHAKISGHVRHYDGSPVAGIDLVLIGSDNSWYWTDQTDEKGYFEFDSLDPGKFVLGLNFPKRPDWFNGGCGGDCSKAPPASQFYPGVPDRSAARIIELATDEKLDHLDFTIPAK